LSTGAFAQSVSSKISDAEGNALVGG
jgi:hypothetical protein